MSITNITEREQELRAANADLVARVKELEAIAYSDDGAGGEGMKLFLENRALKAELAALAKQDRAIRRMFCAAVAKQPYMDDGEASDQEIDFLRDSPEGIQHKYQQRRAKAFAAMKGEAA